MTDWLAIRTELIRLRARHETNQSKFAADSGISRATVGRIEDLEGEPDYGSDLETVQKWVEHCGVELHDFFLTIKQQITVSGRQERDKDRSASSVSEGARDHESHGLSSPDAVALTELRLFITHLAEVLAAAAGTHPSLHRSLSEAPDQATGDSDVSA